MNFFLSVVLEIMLLLLVGRDKRSCILSSDFCVIVKNLEKQIRVRDCGFVRMWKGVEFLEFFGFFINFDLFIKVDFNFYQLIDVRVFEGVVICLEIEVEDFNLFFYFSFLQ